MRIIRNFFYLIGQGFVGVFRNSIMSTASILILVCCMLVIGTFTLVIAGVNQSLEQVKDLNVIMAYISPSATVSGSTSASDVASHHGDETTLSTLAKSSSSASLTAARARGDLITSRIMQRQLRHETVATDQSEYIIHAEKPIKPSAASAAISAMIVEVLPTPAGPFFAARGSASS